MMKGDRRVQEQLLESTMKFIERWEKGLNPDMETCPENIRRLCANLLNNYFRYRGFVTNFIAELTKNRRIDTNVEIILELAMTQLMFQDGILPEHAVNAVVDFSKKMKLGATGFINGVLRNFLRKYRYLFVGDTVDALHKQFKHKYNEFFLGKEIYNSWSREFTTEQIDDFVEILEYEPEFSVRLRTNRENVEIPDYLEELILDFPVGESRSYRCLDPHRFFTEGQLENFFVQDSATLFAANLVEVKDGAILGDFCAAPGGKSVILAERLKGTGKLYSCDSNSARLKLIEENLEEFENVEIKVNNARQSKFKPETFDSVLLDVPCSNSGVIRKNPDVKWRYNKRSVKELVTLQRQILEATLPLIKKGGSIVYSTCSVDARENRQQVAKFIENNPSCELITERQLLPTFAHDAAYAALIRVN